MMERRVDKMPKIFIDLGHGGKDAGAIGNGLSEKDVVLDIGLRIKEDLLIFKDVEILLSREVDEFLSLDERTEKANSWGADIYISVHNNSFTEKTSKGFESFIFNGNVSSGTIAFQNVLHAEILQAIGAEVEDRGKKRANFHVLRESNMKAVLTENLFVSNASDAKLLKSDSFRQRIANGHVAGIVKFLGLQLIEQPTEEPVKIPKSEKLYKVQVGAFSDEENADNLVKELKNKGYRAYVFVKRRLYRVQVGAFEHRENAEALEKLLLKEGYEPYINYE
jgi:N-acetylmuramoyl-L-alanine amidase